MSVINRLPKFSLLCVTGLTLVSLRAQTLTDLKQFSSGSPEGGPWSTMVEVQPGLFYGTTAGSASSLGAGGGTLFSITSGGTFTHLHQFSVATADRPIGQLIQAIDGMLYGTTFGTGIEPLAPRQAGYASSLFRSDLKGNISTVANFTSMGPGAVATPPTAGADGAIYGCVGFFNFPNAVGIVYRYSLNGVFTVLHVFPAIASYMNPLVQASDGNLYGAVPLGSTNLYEEIFRISPAGKYTPLLQHPFDVGGILLTEGADGKLYGVDGFSVNDLGQAFRLNLDGSGYQVLQEFGSQGGCSNEFTALTLASDGSLYAGCNSGFANGSGGIFRLTPEGKYQSVYSFTGSQGLQLSSLSGLAVQGSDGILYGEFFGGVPGSANGNGAIYALRLNLPKPLPETRVLTPSMGSAGTDVLIFGSGFLRASAVSFNGVSAPFAVASGSYIEATVPAGATTGPITVTAPNGSSVSQVNFIVP